ncbi:MAG: methyl-accepting chemotaxis protein [Lachnospiraceae bacterium]|nr:methyl-accepting chemotaxis protein [Lachnospiraceae bacterium]
MAKDKKLKVRYGLKEKIITLVALAVILSSTIVSAIAYSRSSTILEESAVVSMDDSMNIIETQISNLLDSTYNIAKMSLASGYLAKDMDEAAEQALYKYFAEWTENYPEIINMIYSRPDTIYIYPLNPAMREQVPGNSSWFNERAAEESDYNWLQPYIDAATNQWCITLYHKVKVDGQFIGFIEIDVSLAHIEEMIQSITLGETGYLMISDFDGIVGIHQNKDLLNKDIPDEELRQFVSNNTEGTLSYQSVNERKFVVLDTLDTAIQWKMVGIVPEEEVKSQSKALLGKIMTVTIGIVIICIIAAILIASRITKEINRFMLHLEAMGAGDLKGQLDIHSKDEIGVMGHILNKMTEQLGSLIGGGKKHSSDMLDHFTELSRMSASCLEATSEIAVTIDHVAEGAQVQSTEVESMVTNFGELSDSMQEISDSIAEIGQQFVVTQEVQKESLKIVDQLMETTKETSRTNEEVKNAIYDIDHSSSEIDMIVKTITEIAEQTNLLSLNASIEAARAGEMGRGFVVVAEEVRKLADETARFTDEIKVIIDKMKSQTKQAVKQVEDAKSVMGEQVETAKKTRDSFTNLEGAIHSLEQKVERIGTANKEMIAVRQNMDAITASLAEKAEENMAATEQMNAVTEEQLAIFSQVNTMITELSTYAKELNNEMNVFITD